MRFWLAGLALTASFVVTIPYFLAFPFFSSNSSSSDSALPPGTRQHASNSVVVLTSSIIVLTSSIIVLTSSIMVLTSSIIVMTNRIIVLTCSLVVAMPYFLAFPFFSSNSSPEDSALPPPRDSVCQ